MPHLQVKHIISLIKGMWAREDLLMNAVEGGVGVSEGQVHVRAFVYLPHCSSVEL